MVRLQLALGLPLALTGCAAMGPPRPPSLDLPKAPADLRAVRKGDKVTLTWSVPTVTTDHATVRNLGVTRICRSTAAVLKECGTPVGEAAPEASSSGSNGSSTSSSSSTPTSGPSSRPSSRAGKGAHKVPATYTDNLFSGGIRPETSGFAMYAVEVLNGNGRGAGLSNQVRVPLAATLPAPNDFGAEVTGLGVVLNWKPALVGFGNPNPAIYVYRIYRRSEGEKAALLGEVPLLGQTNLSFTDSTMEWEQTYYYHVEAVTVVAATNGGETGVGKKDEAGAPKKIEIEGDESAEVKVFVHDVFPPAVPMELQAVFSGPGQAPAIDLVWAPVTDLDLAGYNVYRHGAGEAPVKINLDLVKAPGYRDAGVDAGKSYLYSVSAVDVRGNESARSAEAEERVP